MENNTGVIWFRVSSEAQTSGFSLDAQERQLKEFVERNQINILRSFRVQESAKESQRRKFFKEMIEFVKNEKVAYLVSYDVDRLARNYRDFYTIQTLIDDHGVTVAITSSNKIVNKNSLPEDRFMFQFLGSYAEMENRKRGQNTRDKMAEKVRQGQLPGHAPEGYLNVADPTDLEGRRRIVVLEPEKKVDLVKLAFELYAKGGYSYETLKDELNRRGFLTKATSKRPSAPIKKRGVQEMLKSPFYYGLVRWKGFEKYPGVHVPIISKELFDRVQFRLAENCSNARGGTNKFFAFKPFLRCGYCGGNITAESKGENLTYYRCTYGRDRNCPQGYFEEREIDALFADALGQLYLDDQIVEGIKSHLKRSHFEDEDFEKKERKRLENLVKEKRKHLSLAYNDRLRGDISIEMYREKQVEIENDIQRIELEKKKLGQRNFKYKEQGSMLIELLQGFKDIYLKQDLKGKQRILTILLKHCIIKGEKRAHRGSVINKEETHFIWKPPFNTLFSVARVLKSEKRGE